MAGDKLVITKIKKRTGDDYLRSLKVTAEHYRKVRAVADETRRDIYEVAGMLLEYALAHLEIKEE